MITKRTQYDNMKMKVKQSINAVCLFEKNDFKFIEKDNVKFVVIKDLAQIRKDVYDKLSDKQKQLIELNVDILQDFVKKATPASMRK